MRVALIRSLALAILSWTAAILPLSAQDHLAMVRGTIRGQTAAPVSGASVVAKNLETGQSRSASSDAGGRFEIAGLAPGPYELEVTRSGFLSQTRNPIALAAAQSLTVEFVLRPSAAPAAADSERISESQLAGLPLNGRSYSQLATLQAGVADTSNAQASRGVGGGSLTVSGARSSSNNFLMDGTNIMDAGNRVPRSAAGVQLGSDAVYQVQVFSTNYSAEYGRGSGGVLNSITRSGTSQLHGTLFEYFRNSKLDARNVIDPDPDPPPFKRNQFGFTLTGPLRKDRTFFVLSFEAMRDRLTETDLSFFPDANARQGVITDERGTAIRTFPVDPAVQPYLALYPVPNRGPVGQGFGINAAPVFQPTNEGYWSFRVDHKLSDRDSFFVRYTFDDATGTNGQGIFLFRSFTQSRQQYLTLVGTHIFDLRTLMAVRLGYTRPADAIESLSSVEIPRSLYFVPNAPQFGQIEVPGAAAFGPANTTPEENTMNSFQFADDVVAQRGPHSLKFGTEIHRYRWDIFNSSHKGGVWFFNSLDSFLAAPTAQNPAPKQGTSLTVALTGSDNHKGFRQTLAALYVQDNLRLSSRLQLNLGLRYELATIIKEKDGRMAFLPDPVQDTSLQLGNMLKDNPSLLNFSPRIGLTWSPPGRRSTVVSAGFGIYSDPLLEYVIDLQKNAAPFYRRAVIPNFDATGVFPDAVSAAAKNSLGSRFEVQVLDYNHMTTPKVMRYNFTLQQEVAAGLRVQAAYVGARGNHLFRGYEANLYPVPITRADGSLFFPPNEGPINPAFGALTVTSTDAQSFYNALQLSANKSFGRGTTIQANYTYSKSVDDASNPSGATSSAPNRQYPLDRTLERGLSDFDLRHRVSINYFYVLPFGAGQRWWKSGVLSQVFGGWRVGGIASYRAGTAFLPRVNVRTAGFLFVANRPNLRPGYSNNPTNGVTTGCADSRGETLWPAGQKLGTPDRYFDPCAFSVPEPGTLGNVGRNTIFGPSVFTTDVSLQKEFVLGGERRLQFRAEWFNVPNHPNFASPSGATAIVFAGAFPGRPNGTVARLLHPATTSRQMQFALRLNF